MRTTYLVTYDIRDPKRLRAVFNTCDGYGDHLQLSVFRCDLNPTELLHFRRALSQIIHHVEDQVLFVDIGPAEGRARTALTTLGRAYDPPERTAIIV